MYLDVLGVCVCVSFFSFFSSFTCYELHMSGLGSFVFSSYILFSFLLPLFLCYHTFMQSLSQSVSHSFTECQMEKWLTFSDSVSRYLSAFWYLTFTSITWRVKAIWSIARTIPIAFHAYRSHKIHLFKTKEKKNIKLEISNTANILQCMGRVFSFVIEVRIHVTIISFEMVKVCSLLQYKFYIYLFVQGSSIYLAISWPHTHFFFLLVSYFHCTKRCELTLKMKTVCEKRASRFSPLAIVFFFVLF